MQTLSEIRGILESRGLRPKHRFGQNFLHDKNLITLLVDAAHIAADDLVLEIGPGTGTLTEALLDRDARVIVCELDADMAAIIRERLGARITLIEGDALDRGRTLNPEIRNALADHPYKLVANLPYQAASPIMGTLAADPLCRGQYVTVQKEVADRLRAQPGSRDYGALTIIIGALADVRRLAVLKPTCFWPQPKVDSAMIAIEPKPHRDVTDPAAFARFVVHLFSQRRKQLGTILGRGTVAHWPPDIQADHRPETLTIAQFIALWQRFADFDTGSS